MNPEIRLQAFVRAELARPFAWGDTNCVALALRAVDAMHGTGLHVSHHRHMGSAARARVWTRKHGAYGVVTELLKDGLFEIPTTYSQPGDILIGETDDGQIAAHVCLGLRVLSSTEADGVILRRRADLSPAPMYCAAWRLT